MLQFVYLSTLVNLAYVAWYLVIITGIIAESCIPGSLIVWNIIVIQYNV